MPEETAPTDPAGPALREEQRATLDTERFWQLHGPHVVKAGAVTGAPFFYPVYRWGDLYSFSPFPLLLRKGTLRVDPAAEADLKAHGHDVTPPRLFLDADIRRVGGPPDLHPAITDPDVFARAMADAMQSDRDAVEAANPGKTNIVLCGGRDSLNLLLLKARNPVIAFSAEPNLPLVRDFVRDNGLDIPVLRLEDIDDPALRPREIAEACGMVDLVHWKWTAHLRRIAAEHDHGAVFWKGQFADAVLTDYWRSYTASPSRPYRFLRRAYRKAAPRLPSGLTAVADRVVLRDFRQTIPDLGGVAGRGPAAADGARPAPGDRRLPGGGCGALSRRQPRPARIDLPGRVAEHGGPGGRVAGPWNRRGARMTPMRSDPVPPLRRPER